MNKFVLELPWFLYNKDQLLDYQKNIQDWIPNKIYAEKNIDTSLLKFFDYFLDKDDFILNEIKTQLKFDLKQGFCKFTKVLQGGTMPYHYDPDRTCILMIPITSDPSPIKWKFLGKIRYEHTYRCPAIINGKIQHGVPEVKKDRIFLQLSVPATWDELTKNLHQFFILP